MTNKERPQLGKPFGIKQIICTEEWMRIILEIICWQAGTLAHLRNQKQVTNQKGRSPIII